MACFAAPGLPLPSFRVCSEWTICRALRLRVLEELQAVQQDRRWALHAAREYRQPKVRRILRVVRHDKLGLECVHRLVPCRNLGGCIRWRHVDCLPVWQRQRAFVGFWNPGWCWCWCRLRLAGQHQPLGLSRQRCWCGRAFGLSCCNFLC